MHLNRLIFNKISNKMHFILILLVLTNLQSANVFAVNLDEIAKGAKEAGQAAAGKAQPLLNSYFTDMNNHQLKETVGFEGVNVKGNNMELDRAESEGLTNLRKTPVNTGDSIQNSPPCNKDDCAVGRVFGSSATLKRQEEIEKIGIEKDEKGMPINNKGYLDKAFAVTKQAKDMDYFGGEADCKEGEDITTTYSKDVCDQYYSRKVSSCFPRQVVEIDPEYSYICNKKRETKIKTCSETITSITCKDSKECDLGGIEPSSVASDMKYEHKDGVLTIGTIADNYWRGTCATYDRTTRFRIKNVSKIKDFTIFRVGFDDYLQIIINDHTVYVGPDGGHKLEVRAVGGKRRLKVHNGNSDRACERDTNWNNEVNIDLKPYLKEGENILKTRVIVSGAGEGWLQIRAKQNCCSKWDISRGTTCKYS
jgi:hypothetical protein